MATTNNLEYSLLLKADKIDAVLNNLLKSIEKIDPKINLDKSLGNAGNSGGKAFSKGFENSIGNVASIVNSAIGNTIANAVSSGFSKASDIVSTQFNSSAGLESTRLALNGLLGDSKRAGEVLAEVVDFAAKTPFEIPQLADTAKLLAGYGVSVDNIVPSLKTLGDAATGTGTPLGQIARNFAQIQTQGKAGLIDLRQFAGAGIPIFGQLQKTLGKTKDEIEELASSGGITSDIVTKAFKDMSAKGGVFFDAMNNGSNSVTGRLSTLSDNFSTLIRNVIGLSNEGEILKGGLFATISNGVLSVSESIKNLDVKPFSDAINSLLNAGILLFSGNFNGNIFGLGQDSPIIEILFGIRESFNDIGKFAVISGLAIQQTFDNLTSSIPNELFTIDLPFKELSKTVADGALVTALALIAISLGSIAISSAIAAAPFIALALAVSSVIAIFQNFETVATFLKPVTDLISQLFAQLATPEAFAVINSSITLIKDVFTALQPTLLLIGVSIALVVANLITFGQYVFTTLYPVLLNLINSIIQLADAVLPPLLIVFGLLVGAITTLLVPILQILGGFFTEIFAGIVTTVTGAVQIITGVINVIVGLLQGLLTGDFTRFSTGLKQIFSGLVTFISGIAKTLFSPIIGAFDGIVNFIKSIDLFKIGLNFIQGLANGIANGASAIGNSIRNAFSNITLPGGLKIPGFAEGGLVQGKNVFALLNDGNGQEFVMNAEATKRNRALLELLNSGGSLADVKTNNFSRTSSISNNQDQRVDNSRKSEVNIYTTDTSERRTRQKYRLKTA